jgi:hypothetical protein
MEDAFAGRVIDERVQSADHFGVRRGPLSHLALRQRVPNYPVGGQEQMARLDTSRTYLRNNQKKTDGISTLRPQYLAFTLPCRETSESSLF